MKYKPAPVGEEGAVLDDPTIIRSESSQETKPPIRTLRAFPEIAPYGLKLDLHGKENEDFDAAEYKMAKKEVQGSKRTDIDSMIFGRQKH